MGNDKLEEMLKDLTDGLLESLIILMSDEGEKFLKGDNSNLDLVVATGDVTSPISNKDYQIQVSLVVNKALWLGEQTIGYRDTLGSFKTDGNFDENQN